MAQQTTDRIRSQINRDVLLHWRALTDRLSRRPQRADLDPLDFRQELLHHMFLAQVERGPFAVKILLQGEYITQRAGQTLIGKYIDKSSFGEGWETVLTVYRRVFNTGHPICTRERQMGPNGWLIEAEVLHLPLVNDAQDVVYIYGSLDRIDLSDLTDGSTGSPDEWDVTDYLEFDE